MAEPVLLDAMAETRSFLVFDVSDRLYALPAEEVAEVMRLPPVAKVPQAPAGLMGLANLRGRVTPVAGLRGLLGSASTGGATQLVLVLAGDAAVAIGLESAPRLVSVADVQTEDAQVVARAGEKLRGIFDAGDGQIAHILDVQALLAAAFVPAAPRALERRTLKAQRAADDGRNDEGETRVVSFLVSGQEFALELDDVREIILAPDAVVAVPHAEELVIGVTAYREALLPLLSLRGLLGLEDYAAAERPKVIVSHVGGALVGLLADEAKSIVTAPESEMDPPPAVLAARMGAESQIKAIYRAEEGRRLISILAPDRLFRDDIMQRLTKQMAAPMGDEGDAGAEAYESFLVFSLGDDEFALPIESVIEVARIPAQITKVPKTPAFLEGVMSFRGEVLPVVDQRRRFDMPVLEGDGRRRIVVVRSGRHRAALIVDAVTEVLNNPKDQVDPAPDLAGERTRLVQGVINLEASARMVMILDPLELLSRAERGLLDAFAPALSEGK
jgi:purine-binding chemotaxis protein CheW